MRLWCEEKSFGPRYYKLLVYVQGGGESYEPLPSAGCLSNNYANRNELKKTGTKLIPVSGAHGPICLRGHESGNDSHLWEASMLPSLYPPTCSLIPTLTLSQPA